ncbi:2-trimethylaminoethylphosphonate dioxygenase [Denitrobaculum tricleocarpae]|uniref:trimethyllysine dioxygenase n=1 Tax=Denitrobaculum tricleocarpae TaxID=2591009 RepID=A0A545TF33_9PROT|nr:gamma-butyrobetaine dioxygenase [Denitrobaculum tricleocarpae]TQV75791.1 gamma-butyrobetaine dioxygenase [Denitrobaculum tricleocarpae]
MVIKSVNLLQEGQALAITWSNGKTARFHAIWLRDNALDPETRSASNGQRLVTLLDCPENTRIESARAEEQSLALRFLPDGKEVSFPAAWLAEHNYDRIENRPKGWTGEAISRWGSDLASAIPTVDLAAAKNDRRALAGWLGAIRRCGFAVMTGLKPESGALLEVAALFGYVRETNYGRWFEVRSEVNPVNLAYTGLGLQAHSDNPYRDPVPTLQLLACLENSAEGGDSKVVDGFKALEILQKEAPEHFDLLACYPARFEYAGSDGIRLRAKRPMVELGPDRELLGLRFNNRSAAPFTDIPFDDMATYYAAYRHLAEIIERPEGEVTFKMKPGDLFIVDNTRVLHARKGFSGTGSRWLQGCYADKDDLLSTLAAIEEELPEAAE